jgi:hypothetical protein
LLFHFDAYLTAFMLIQFGIEMCIGSVQVMTAGICNIGSFPMFDGGLHP